MPGELHGEVPSEPVGGLYNYGLCAVGGETLQHLRKAWALVDAVGTAHGLVVILTHDGKACSFGERINAYRCPCRLRHLLRLRSEDRQLLAAIPWPFLLFLPLLILSYVIISSDKVTNYQ